VVGLLASEGTRVAQCSFCNFVGSSPAQTTSIPTATAPSTAEPAATSSSSSTTASPLSGGAIGGISVASLITLLGAIVGILKLLQKRKGEQLNAHIGVVNIHPPKYENP
jgi:hypothetical protein